MFKSIKAKKIDFSFHMQIRKSMFARFCDQNVSCSVGGRPEGPDETALSLVVIPALTLWIIPLTRPGYPANKLSPVGGRPEVI